MRALVTGGAGFIGSHVVDLLVAAGHDVTVADDLSTGKRDWLNPAANFREVDIVTPELDGVVAEAQPEAVFHLAAHASVSESVADPVFDARVNVLGTVRLLRACAAVGVGRVVFSSTGGALYGEPEQLPCDEEHPVRPLAPYGASKAAGEAYVHAFASLGGFEPTILRYANVYGPRQDPYGEAGVIAIFTQRMLAGQTPVIFGDGAHERDYVFAGDVASANLAALESPGGVYNIGTGIGTTVSDVFAQLAEATGFPEQPRHEAERAGDVRRIFLDASRARDALGWAPAVGLSEGLRRTVAFFQER